jgi:lysophospholipase L1-like esterase
MPKHVIESDLTKAAVGLGNVDNTSDAAKPVSTAQQTALNGKSNVGHVHGSTEITGIDGGTAAARITNIQPRNATVSEWGSANPVLNDGEMGLETDTGKVKFGDGVSVWTALPYAVPGGSGLQTLDPPGAWEGYLKARDNAMNTPIRWLALGDSITEGTGVTVRSDTWLNKAAVKLRAAYPSWPQTNPLGWVPIVQASTTLPSNFTLAGTYNTTSTFGFRGNQTVNLSQNATITGTVTGTSIDIWHAKGTASGTFTVKVDNVQVGGNYGGTNSVTASGFKQTVSLGAAGSHTIVITNNSTGAVYINGITVWNGNENSGLVVANAGRHGWTSQNWEDVANSPNWDEDIATFDPHLVTILLGANDYTGLVGRAAYADNLRTVINKIRDSQNYYASIVLVACFKRSETVYPRWEHYEFAMQSLAAELGCAYIDLRDVMPDVGTQEAIDNSYYTDTVHPSAAGAERIALEISRVLMDPALGTVPAAVPETTASVAAVANTLVQRGSDSSITTPTPTLAGHAANKGYVDDGRVTGTPGHKFRQVACVIRNTGSGFDFISDASHYPSGVTSVVSNTDNVVVNYSFTASQVASLVATPDEVLAAKGYTIGASVGLSSATLWVGAPGGFSDYISWNGSAWVSFNGYVTSVSMDGTTGLITCTHQDMSSPVGGSVSSRSLTKRASMEGLGTTTTTLYLVDNSGVTVKTPTTDSRFWITRSGSRRVPMSELTFANSNIWLYGLMLVD